MSDAYTPRPEHKFSFGLWTVCNRGRDPFGDVVRPVLSPTDAVALLAEVRRVGREPARQRPRPDRCDTRRARQHRSRIPTGLRAAQDRRPDGDRQSVLRSHLSRRRVHGERRARPRLRGAEDDAGHGHRRRARREDLRALGRTRGHRNRRLPPARRRREAAARSHQLSLRVLHRPEVRLPVRARGQAERAARRHLHGDHGRVPRSDPDARASGPRGRQSRGRARAHGRTELRARGRARRGRPASCSTSI